MNDPAPDDAPPDDNTNPAVVYLRAAKSELLQCLDRVLPIETAIARTLGPETPLPLLRAHTE